MLLLLEPDFGAATVIMATGLALLFLAGVKLRHFLALVVLAAGGMALLAVTSVYRLKRLTAFLDPWADPQGAGYQAIQSMIAVGTGGFFGRGLMGGMQKLYYLPEPHNDFIYAVIAEELGLIGATTVLICFCVIAWRGLRTAARAPDRFGAFLAVGLTAMIAFQALLNISVVIGLAPTKGIPLPFVSAGGSSLLINLLGMAILLNVSQHASPPHVVTVAMAKPDA